MSSELESSYDTTSSDSFFRKWAAEAGAGSGVLTAAVAVAAIVVADLVLDESFGYVLSWQPIFTGVLSAILAIWVWHSVRNTRVALTSFSAVLILSAAVDLTGWAEIWQYPFIWSVLGILLWRVVTAQAQTLSQN